MVRRREKEDYSVVLASPEIVLSSRSLFWLWTARQRVLHFLSPLGMHCCDEVHLMWGWRTFRKEYGNTGTPKVVFAMNLSPFSPQSSHLSICYYHRKENWLCNQSSDSDKKT